MSVSQNSDFPDPNPMTVDPTNLGSVDPLSVEGIFLVALSKTGAERGAFLSLQCSDPPQRQRVEALLAAYEQAGNFMEKPAVTAEPVPIGQYLAPCELPGTLGKLGPYEILEEIGRGGMGVVFRAHDPKLQRIVAVKALAPELARLPSARQRFLREARAAAAISHPHVVTIFAVEGTEEASLGTERTTLPFLVMECVVGQTLHDKIKRVGALKVEEIIRISRQIAEGLTAAHKRGLIHRDIKPANILLENGVERVKITDFGLARTTTDGGITHTGEILGTPQCMSPEQARGDIVDQRSDLFSLGCVMYSMCTGVSPFRADNMLAVMKKVCEVTPRPIAQLNPAIPEWLCELVHRLLEKEPDRRMQTAGDVVDVLETRSVAAAPRVVYGDSGDKAPEPVRPLPDDIPKWMQTQIIPGLEQWLFKDGLLPVTLIALLIGFFLGDDDESLILMLPVAGVLGLGLMGLVKKWLKARWTWINWKSLITVPFGMLLGGIGRAWLIFRSRSGSGLVEEFARSNAGWVVFPLAIVIFWLLSRYFRNLFIRNPLSASEAHALPTQPMHWSTWAILGMTVIVVGVLAWPDHSRPSPAVIESVLVIYAVALNVWVFVHLVAWGIRLARTKETSLHSVHTVVASGPHAAEPMKPRSPWSVLGWMLVAWFGVGLLGGLVLATAVVIRDFNSRHPEPMELTYVFLETHGQKIAKVTVDDQEVHSLITPADDNGRPGFLAFAGRHMLHIDYVSDNPQEEKFYRSAVNISGGTTVIDAVPLVRPLPANTPAPANPMTSNASPATDLFVEPSGTMAVGSTPTLPLVDAVEVLTDPAQMPEFEGDRVEGSEPDVRVWINEPGLIISLKRMDFSGPEGSGLMYDSRNVWGVNSFREAQSGKAVQVPPGRYQVLVQDLDYGWSIDQRGTIQIGNGVQTIHVRRRFRQLKEDGHQFPLPFRWTGKTYQISTAEQVSAINSYLAILSGDPSTVTPGAEWFIGHPLRDQIVNIQPAGHWTLQYQPRKIRLTIDGNQTVVHFRDNQGAIRWSRSVPEGFNVPPGLLKYQVVYGNFSWPGMKDELIPIDPATTDPLVIPPLSRKFIKEVFMSTMSTHGSPGLANDQLTWFRQYPVYMNSSAVPVVRKLVQAWVDGMPEVPESELLAIARESFGSEYSWEQIWQYPAAEVHLMSSILVPGNTPGTWRIKEPPEGAVQPSLSTPR